MPIFRDGRPIGAISVWRHTVRPFTEAQLDLLKTFAAQAIIAIDNVRPFRELEAKNTALTHAHGRVTEALEQQTATAEILRVISQSPTDVQPVFDTIAQSALRLLRGWSSGVYPGLRQDNRVLSGRARRVPSPPPGSFSSIPPILKFM